jgi:hypothetical protein
MEMGKPEGYREVHDLFDGLWTGHRDDQLGGKTGWRGSLVLEGEVNVLNRDGYDGCSAETTEPEPCGDVRPDRQAMALKGSPSPVTDQAYDAV